MTDSDVPDYADRMSETNEFIRPARRASIEYVRDMLTRGTEVRILDVGCGPGGNFQMFVNVFDGHVEIVGADFSEPHLRVARQLVENHELEGVVTIEEVDLTEELPFERDHFDLVWASNLLFPSQFERPAEIITKLKPYLRPGGLMAVSFVAWGRSVFLPGYPRLERLLHNAVTMKYERQYELHETGGFNDPERAVTWLRETGFTDTSIEFFPVVHRSGPDSELDSNIAAAIETTFTEEYGPAVEAHGEEVGMDEEDRELWTTLSDSNHPDYILKNDYYCVPFSLLTVGRRPQSTNG